MYVANGTTPHSGCLSMRPPTPGTAFAKHPKTFTDSYTQALGNRHGWAACLMVHYPVVTLLECHSDTVCLRCGHSGTRRQPRYYPRDHRARGSGGNPRVRWHYHIWFVDEHPGILTLAAIAYTCESTSRTRDSIAETLPVGTVESHWHPGARVRIGITIRRIHR